MNLPDLYDAYLYLVPVDAGTLNSFLLALIPLLITLNITLQQINAYIGRKRGAEQSADTKAARDLAASAAISIGQHNVEVKQQLAEIKQVSDSTNKIVKNGGTTHEV